jgi:hypothetical protein
MPAAPAQQGGWYWDGSNWVCDPDCGAPPSSGFPCPPPSFPPPGCPPWFPPPQGQPPWYPGANAGVSFSATAPPNPIRGNFWWDGKVLWMFDGAVWVNTAQGATLRGVTDGSDAAPGIVGEFVQTTTNFNISGAMGAVNTVTATVLSPGDWDCTAGVYPGTVLKGMIMGLNPIPVGVTTGMTGIAIDQSAMAADATEVIVIGFPARALVSVPTQFTFNVTSNVIAAGNAAAAQLLFVARRRR